MRARFENTRKLFPRYIIQPLPSTLITRSVNGKEAWLPPKAYSYLRIITICALLTSQELRNSCYFSLM